MTKQKMMIVEDNLDQLKWLEKVFQPTFDVFPASTGLEAQKIFYKYQTDIDILILDIRLPDMSAFELLNSLEKMCFPGIPPTVVQTEYNDKKWIQEMFGEYRALNYMVKPFDQADIEEAVQNALKADPYIYKGGQIEERMQVMMSLSSIREILYHRVTKMGPEEQNTWIPHIMELFNVYGVSKDEIFPSVSRDDFKLTASLAPVFELINNFYGIPLPDMKPFRLGVRSSFKFALQTILMTESVKETGGKRPVFEMIETDHPREEDQLDIWVSDLQAETVSAWKEVASELFKSRGIRHQPTYGVVVTQTQDRDKELLKEAILNGAACGMFQSEDFSKNFYALLVKLAIRRYELAVIHDMSRQVSFR